MLETTTFLKIVYNTIIFVVSTLLAYLNISIEPFGLFAVLLIFDYITGLMKAKRLNESITSNKMKYGLASKLVLLLIPLTIAIASKAVGADAHYILLSGMYILILSEAYSIIGNVYAFNKKEELPEIDALAVLAKYIRNILMIRVGGGK
jgi:phage-related holin